MRVGYVREDGYEGVHFEDDDGNTLGIERADEFDEADIAAGMDTYCIVLGSGQVVYGGVESWAVDAPGHAMLVISDEAAEALGVEFTAFDIDADPAELAAVDPVVQRLIVE